MMRLVIKLTRPECVGASHTPPATWQDYLIDITVFADRRQSIGTQKAALDWEVMDANLQGLRASEPSPNLLQQVGDQLRDFLGAGWNQCEQVIRRATADDRTVDITVVSNADEVYRLPWELLTLAGQGSRVEADERVVIGYALPPKVYVDGPAPGVVDRPARALFVWSDAGGGVPFRQHREALDAAFGERAVDEIEHVTLGKLDSALQALEPDAAVALHILCHGSAHDGGFSLAWNADRLGGDARVSAYALRDTLLVHAGKLAMVNLCTCGGADAGEPDRALGSVAQEVHKLGVPWVVGARYRLSPRGSIVFAREFYDRLCADETSGERAYAGARRVLFRDTERRDWLGLQLYARDEHRGRQVGGSGLRTEAPPVVYNALPATDPLFLGREAELDQLDSAWDSPDVRVLTVVARGGEGKTALVKHWLQRWLQRPDTRAVSRYSWTFYSQGTAASGTSARGGASAEGFFEHAIEAFGHTGPMPTAPTQRGEVLARLLAERPTLLIIDGMEPLQHGPGVGPSAGVVQGRLADPGVATLLRQLVWQHASDTPGLCIITTREPVRDIAGQAEVLSLDRLSDATGAHLLERLGARGSEAERRAAARDMDGHALAITLLGTYVRTALDGDLRARHGVELLAERTHGNHASRVMRSYEQWLVDSPERAILRLLGLFDRAASGDGIRALFEPPIPGLTAGLPSPDEPTWRQAVTGLRDMRLLLPGDPGDPAGLDAHPLVREYMAGRLQAEQPDAWRAGHEKLYQHLCAAAPELPDTLRDMEPLFRAVAHGCAAGRHQDVLDQVLWARIDRRNKFFATNKLGAFGAHLGALAHLFEQPFVRPTPGLSAPAQSFLWSEAGLGLRALGRLAEARAPMQAGLDAAVAYEDLKNAAIRASNLAELHQSLGDLYRAEDLARQSVRHADRSDDALERMAMRTTLADVQHQRGQVAAAAALFAAAEAMQAEQLPKYPLLYSLRGYQYCDLLLERDPASPARVRERAEQTLTWAKRGQGSLLDIALDHLTLGRTWLRQAEHTLADAHAWTQARDHLDRAVTGLRAASQEDELPLGLLARAAYHRASLAPAAAADNPAARLAAERDLAEARDIATRGGMRLHLADIALEQTRLALALHQPAEARKHLAEARHLIEATGYHRRAEALANLTAALSAKPE